MICASVVFPPRGPEKITDGKRSASIARRKFARRRMCSWPTSSSNERGRIRGERRGAIDVRSSVGPFPGKQRTRAKYGAADLHQICTGAAISLPDGGKLSASPQPALRNEVSFSRFRAVS